MYSIYHEISHVVRLALASTYAIGREELIR
jgi:hypothetical protein